MVRPSKIDKITLEHIFFLISVEDECQSTGFDAKNELSKRFQGNYRQKISHSTLQRAVDLHKRNSKD